MSLDDPKKSSKGKRLEVDGVFFRWRRGKLVEIPSDWVNVVASPQRIRNRPSKLSGKKRRALKAHRDANHPFKGGHGATPHDD